MTTQTKPATRIAISQWIHEQPLQGSTLWPHHRRWNCRLAIIEAIRCFDEPERRSYYIGRAEAFNCIMYDCHDPMAYRYGARIQRIKDAVNAQKANP